ncbi:hypothetical protein [Streptomyces sp. MW-W600-10]|uniref:hypothetical protein n=1 Tax=Streptomyces sp. MW-W600-10 TaxID=2829819 RepID=UPI001C486C93|nr:hypothetical protein [Streptomyces sp. MW-W600-10]MBV7242355.1 hypothetical protein [Streptomyces sp. MW-W600-10]
MRERGLVALEAAGMAVTALASQAVIRGLLDRDTELLWGLLGRVPGGSAGPMLLLGLVALLSVVAGGWAHIRRESAVERAGGHGAVCGRETVRTGAGPRPRCSARPRR